MNSNPDLVSFVQGNFPIHGMGSCALTGVFEADLLKLQSSLSFEELLGFANIDTAFFADQSFEMKLFYIRKAFANKTNTASDWIEYKIHYGTPLLIFHSYLLKENGEKINKTSMYHRPPGHETFSVEISGSSRLTHIFTGKNFLTDEDTCWMASGAPKVNASRFFEKLELDTRGRKLTLISSTVNKHADGSFWLDWNAGVQYFKPIPNFFDKLRLNAATLAIVLFPSA
jgi:hypothetical protein